MILLTGATGQVGLRVTRQLADRDDVRALARSDQAAARLAELGVPVVRGDLDDPATLPAAFDGAKRVLLLTQLTARQLQQEQNALDAAGDARIVKVSAPSRGIAYSQAHEAIEERLRVRGGQWTSLHANFFTSNLLAALPLIRQGMIAFPAGEVRLPFVDPQDVAEVAVHQLLADTPENGAVPVTGPEALSMTTLAARISLAVGHEVRYVDAEPKNFLAALLARGLPEFTAGGSAEFFENFLKRYGDQVPSTDVQRLLGRPAHPVDRFLREELAPAVSTAELPGTSP